MDFGRLKRRVFLGLVAACASSVHVAAGIENTIGLVTSVTPITLIVRELGGDRVRLNTLVPPGATPHTFEPVPSDLVKLQGARYFIRIGGGLDGWSDKLLGAAPTSLDVVTLLSAPGMNPLRDRDSVRGHHLSRGDVGYNPHFWLDPFRVRDVMAPLVTQRLIEADPAGKSYYEARAKEFRKRLTALDGEITAALRQVRARKYVAFHNSWRYFAERYGLEEVAVVQEAAGEEPTPREVAELVRRARAAGIGNILVEPQLDPRIAETLATEFGAGTVVVDPLGDPGDPARSTYEKLMLFNARAFRRALTLKRND